MANSIESYQEARRALIAEERALSYTKHLASPSTKVEKAIQLIHSLREEEEASLWRSPAYQGMPFTKGKQIIEQSKLFQLIRQMPKGAILHCHLDALNDPHALLRLALSHPTLCVSASASLIRSPDARLAFTTVPSSASIFSSTTLHRAFHDLEYEANTLVPAVFAREQFVGGPDAFDKWVVSFLTVDAESIAWSPAQVWEHFLNTFVVARGLLAQEAVFGSYIEEVFTICAKDNVPYLECRINFLHEFMFRASGTFDFSHREWVKIFGRTVDVVKKRAGTTHPFWGARIIYSTVRFIEPGEGHGRLRWYLEDCLKLKAEFPDIIAGFDLVGWEDGLRPLSDYLPDLLWFKERQKEVGLDIPYLFHAGETLGDGSKADMNLYDAILLDTKRIGHGLALPQHPLLMSICREKKIAVECCPISNELLRYTASASTHPLAVLLNSDVPITLSCDDPQYFGNLGLSYDFYQTFTASEKMTVTGLGKLARDSIEYSMMSSLEKEQRLAAFDTAFGAFIDLVIDNLEIAT